MTSFCGTVELSCSNSTYLIALSVSSSVSALSSATIGSGNADAEASPPADYRPSTPFAYQELNSSQAHPASLLSQRTRANCDPLIINLRRARRACFPRGTNSRSRKSARSTRTSPPRCDGRSIFATGGASCGAIAPQGKKRHSARHNPFRRTQLAEKSSLLLAWSTAYTDRMRQARPRGAAAEGPGKSHFACSRRARAPP
ncbi:hypothetical protein K523DRAFT_82087 [Schizophyllum commune Tattone D]|nr:hypothetical protein K523DRAFT_82087 [Schizophyllum commune Tattone D]